MKKLISVILSLLMLVTLCACSSAENSSAPADESSKAESVDDASANSSADISDDSSDVSSAPEAPEYLPEPTINGTKLSEFVLVYKESNDCAQYKTIVLEMYDFIKATYGIELKYRSERLVAADHEIIVGLPVTRLACSDYRTDYGYGGYKLVVKENNVVFAASYPNGCYFAYQEFKKLLDTAEDITDTEVEGSEDVIKVACVGDSITHGINSVDKINKIYPAYLQGMLGWNYYVINAGLSGYSTVNTDDYAYCKSVQYKDALRFVPDVVIYALGTNDANPSPNQPYKNWEDPANNREEKFLESTRELLDSFYDVNPDCQIFLCYPASLFKVGNDQWNAIPWAEGIEKYVRPLLEQIVAEYEIPTVDFWQWSKDNSYVFTDGLHPKDETYEPFAKHIYDNIKDIISAPEVSE